MSEVGRPPHFNVDTYLDVVEMYIASDEVERALWLLDNAPAFYRDYPPPRALEIRESLHRQLFTPVQYAMADAEGVTINAEILSQYWPDRAQVLGTKIKELNDKGIKPNLMEIGAGTFWLPYSLRSRNHDFTYEHKTLGLESRILPFDKPPIQEGINMFVCYELAEHLWNEVEIYQNYLKFKKKADYIFLSTPLYTCGGVNKDWRNHSLGHLRNYTPREFVNLAQGLFKGYEWTGHLSDTITLVGSKE